MVKDPVCGMEIDEKRAVAKATHEGRTYYFCALACREAFTKAPARYMASEEREKKGAA
jgi:YHS domain-containing protein